MPVYRRTIWRCNEKYKGGKPCQAPHLNEDDIKQRFLAAFNVLMAGRDELLANCRLAQQVLCDCTAIDEELAKLHQEIEVVAELTRKSIYENAHVAVNQDEFNERHSGYMERHQMATEQVAGLETLRNTRREKHKTLEAFIRDIETRPVIIDEFDEKLWLAIIDKVTVLPEGRLVFTFKDGTDIKA